MKCKLISDIKHKCEYNSGGINKIYLLDIRDFQNYVFLEDGLYDSCFVERVKIRSPNYIEIDVVEEANFKESLDKGVYSQTLTSFVHSMEAIKTSGVNLSIRNKYLVVFETKKGHLFSFGSDSGASLNYNQQTGTVGEAEGYNITLSTLSKYPLFELASDAMKVYLLGAQDNTNFILSENFSYLFEIEGYEQ